MKSQSVSAGSRGFTLIETMIVLMIVGLLVSAGLFMFGKTTMSTYNKRAMAQLNDAKNALQFMVAQPIVPTQTVITAFPLANTVDGIPTFRWQTSGYHLGVPVFPLDPWNRWFLYKPASLVSSPTPPDAQAKTQAQVCSATRIPPVNGWVRLLDEVTNGANPPETPVAALLISAGPNQRFDGENLTNLASATGPFRRAYPTADFDDLVVAITPAEMYQAIEKKCVSTVTVTDSRVTGGAYYVYDITAGKDLGSANRGDSITVRVFLNDQIRIQDAPTPPGGGSPIPASIAFPATITAATAVTLTP